MTSNQKPKYTMTMSLNVLKHLGLNLYSNIPSVISEVVANAYDADATKVEIEISNDKIVIRDNGNGMNLEDINKKFLTVGYAKRENDEGLTTLFKRPVMGRKGIGKLSLFSIAQNIEIHSTKISEETGFLENNGFILNTQKIESDIKNNKAYHPEDIDLSSIEVHKGTNITLTQIKKNVNNSEIYLRKRLARRFSFLEENGKFEININNIPITTDDRDYFKKINFLWLIGNYPNDFRDLSSMKVIEKLNGNIDSEKGFEISGWIGTVLKPSDLEQDNINNNKISIFCRGKMAQEDILQTYNEGGIYAVYLIGEIHADFLDVDNDNDIATSNRQQISEDDPRYKALIAYVYEILKKIQSKWTVLRKENAEKQALVYANEISPQLIEWYNTLKSESAKKQAKQLFGTIESLNFDKGEDEKVKKKELYKQGIIAFEKLQLRSNLESLVNIKSADDIRLAAIFTDLNDLEANLFYDIASERVSVIKNFQGYLDNNDKEKLLQNYIFNNLWLLNPSWERPTEGSVIMEQNVQKEFDIVKKTLTKEEEKGRLDIKYRTAAGKHIIVELKRYDPGYSITPMKLYEQVLKYNKALKKCLTAINEKNPIIETIIILGKVFNNEDYKEAQRILNSPDMTCQIMYYDTLIDQSLKSYSDFLEKQKDVSKIRKLIDEL